MSYSCLVKSCPRSSERTPEGSAWVHRLSWFFLFFPLGSRWGKHSWILLHHLHSQVSSLEYGRGKTGKVTQYRHAWRWKHNGISPPTEESRSRNQLQALRGPPWTGIFYFLFLRCFGCLCWCLVCVRMGEVVLSDASVALMAASCKTWDLQLVTVLLYFFFFYLFPVYPLSILFLFTQLTLFPLPCLLP